MANMNRWDRINESGEIKRQQSLQANANNSSTSDSDSGCLREIVLTSIFLFVVIFLISIISSINSSQLKPVNQEGTAQQIPSYEPKSVENINDKIEYQDGSRYEGPLVNSLKEGRGTLFYQNNNDLNYWKYVGEFKNDMKNGSGVLYLNDSTRYEGTWIDDLREGDFIYYDNVGNHERQYFSAGDRVR